MKTRLSHAHSATLGAILFLAFVFAGSGYIIWSKILGLPAQLVTGIPLSLMLIYAGLLLLARYFRLRGDQSGDNLYYLGFLYTLTSLGVSLWQFSITDGATSIVTNFGVAIATTILGIALRVVFNQMRQDPIEVETIARLELADAARKVRQELDGASFEFASFRRAVTQMLDEGAKEQRAHSERLATELFEKLAEIPDRAADPLVLASKQTQDRIQQLAEALLERIKDTGQTLTRQEETLATSIAAVSNSLRDLETRLKALQTPDRVIEIKLQPFIQGFTKAGNNHAKAIDARMAELQKVIAKFDQSVQALADHLSDTERKRTADQEATRQTTAKMSEEIAETRKLVEELAKSMKSVSIAIPPRTESSGGWFRFRGERP